MQQIAPYLYRVEPTRLTPSKYISFFVQRMAGGNLLFPCFSASSTIDGSFAEIEALGGLKFQLLGDSHFRTVYCDAVAQRFGAPLYCSEAEAPDVTSKLKHVIAFPFTRHELSPGIEVIPTPGHRPGGVCYLITLGQRRWLFAGDFVWHDGTRWNAYPTKPGLKQMHESLALCAELDFEMLLCNSSVSNPVYSIELKSRNTRRDFFARIAEQLR